MENKFLYKSNGNYLGFIQNDTIFNRDGIPLGWLEGAFVWDTQGRFRGNLIKGPVGNQVFYIWSNKLAIPPLSKPPRPISTLPSIPPPPANIQPVGMPVGWADAFE
ncbi:MAG: hypothetical protein PHF79_02695 [Candidatus Pacebacteria bacterium]|nr:hypothetical protein [Candidatus Paceibacterota bacterium]